MKVTRVDVRMNEGTNQKERSKKTRIYMFDTGRPHNLETLLTARYMNDPKYFKAHAIPQILAAMGLPETTKVNWSQKAGCSCGCSPGFIIDGAYGQEVFVDFHFPNSDEAKV